MTEPAKTEEKPISKEEQKILDLESQVGDQGATIVEFRKQNVEMSSKIEYLERHLAVALTRAADRHGAWKVQKAEADALKAQLAADPNLAELASLRAEISAAHRAINRKEGSVKDALIQADVHARRAKEQEAKVAVLAATLETMQRARDAAQVRESSAFQKLALVERDLDRVKSSEAEFAKLGRESQAIIHQVQTAHEAGHPAAVAGCKICSALGREVSPAAAPAEVAKS